MQRQSRQKLTVGEFKTKIKEGLKIFSELDLSGFSLSNFETRPIELKSCDLSRSNLSNSKMCEVKFFSLNLAKTLFVDSNLENTNFNRSITNGTNFTRAKMSNAEFKFISIDDEEGPIFLNADLTNADFLYAKIPRANFTGAKLINAKFNGCDLSFAIFCDADLMNASLFNSTFTTMLDFSRANLTNAKLMGLNFQLAIFKYANLKGAFLHSSLRGADLTNADLTNANLYQCDLSRATIVGAKFDGVIRASFSSDLIGMGSASKRFLSFLNRPDLSIDQKKQMLEIEDANPDKPIISKFLIEKTADILKDKFTVQDEKKLFQEFLKKVQELEEELAPKIEKQPLIKQEPGEPLIVVKSEPQEPSRVVNKRQREEGPPASANVGMGSRQDIPQSYRDDEILGAAQILSSMRRNVRA